MILAAITTCRRAPAMVERALKSVIAQTYTDWDCVVVDDSPAEYELRDEVRKMVEEYAARDKRIHYLPLDRNYGAQRARNVALEFAVKGGHEFIAYLDDDDEWLPEKLEKQLARFRECDENTGLVHCNAFAINEWKFNAGEGNVHMKLLMSGQNSIGSTSFPLIRVKCLQEIGGFDEAILRLQDYEMYIRLTEKYHVAYVNEFLINYYNGSWDRIRYSNPKLLRSLELILAKNREVLMTNKRSYLEHLEFLRLRFLQSNDEYVKALYVWLEEVKFSPLNLVRNVLRLCSTLKGILKQWLKIEHPTFFYWLKCKLKGDTSIYTN